MIRRRDILRHAWDSGCQVPATNEQAIRFASELLSDDVRLELRDEPRRALSETEAADAIRAGRVVEVVS